jgi:predicted dithiol-disulfide oxidoreductase (DUF899 family)
MKTKKTTAMPPIVSAAEWRKANEKLLVKEKAASRERDRLAALRRRQPMTKVEKDYVFTGPNGKLGFADLFEGRRQLILYNFMFAPTVDGWPDAACTGCSMFVDQIGHLAHLHARDTSFCLVSRAPLKNLRRYQKRMGWTDIPWYSSEGSGFNEDIGVTTADGETFALNVFFRDGKDVYRTYHTDGRGVEILGSVWTLLDITPYGRQEKGEDSPKGWPQSEAFEWWRRHDEYQGVFAN